MTGTSNGPCSARGDAHCRFERRDGRDSRPPFPGLWKVLRRRHCLLQLRGRLLDRTFAGDRVHE